MPLLRSSVDCMIVAINMPLLRSCDALRDQSRGPRHESVAHRDTPGVPVRKPPLRSETERGPVRFNGGRTLTVYENKL